MNKIFSDMIGSSAAEKGATLPPKFETEITNTSSPTRSLSDVDFAAQKKLAPIFQRSITDARQELDRPVFDLDTGIAQTAVAHQLAIVRTCQALRMAGSILPRIVVMENIPYSVQIRGVVGSYVEGVPRVGLFPPDLDYAGANKIESQKLYERGGFVLRMPDRVVPSDIDLIASIVPFVPRQFGALQALLYTVREGRKLLHGAIKFHNSFWDREITEAEKEIEKIAPVLLAKIFDRTRVFISIRFVDPDMKMTLPSLDEVIDRAKTISYNPDARTPRYKEIGGAKKS